MNERLTPTWHHISPPEAVSEVEIIEVASQPTVVQAFTDLPTSEMRSAFDTTFNHLGAVLTTQGIRPVGAAVSVYHSVPDETVSFEIGLPVDKPLADAVTTEEGIIFQPSELPAGKIARISHIGSYDELGQKWEEFLTGLTSSGHQLEDPFWEIYVTEPSPEMDPATLRTDLVTRIK